MASSRSPPSGISTRFNGSVEAVLDANQGLAGEEQPFRAGLIILLPDLPTPVTEAVTLWD
ncbi:tail protein X [Pseudomonas arsenicoxydans]|uniref:tail protein X n=1 Tax=Pseudomonas arsenicoxydans TaxID=702115 RepID=UPI001E5064E9|nr:tail protein X [Pseudomonas arsenicoxydans]